VHGGLLNNSKIMVIKPDEVTLKGSGQRLPISDKYKQEFLQKKKAL
jgi:hypothetical protein